MLELSQQKERKNRGKYAEDQVRKVLKALSDAKAEFDFERNYDARSSMGRIPRRAGDYTFFYGPRRHGVIEVKEVEHDFRLPKKNFNPDKFGIIRKRQLAGGEVAVLVCHMPQALWRVVPFLYFYERREQPSWDLSEFAYFGDAKTALAAAGIQ